MPKTKNTTRRPKPKTLNHPAKYKVAPDKLLENWAQTVCEQGDDSASHTAAFLLILDEIERADKDFSRISEIVWVGKTAAFRRSVQAEEALSALVEKLRAQNGLRVARAA